MGPPGGRRSPHEAGSPETPAAMAATRPCTLIRRWRRSIRPFSVLVERWTIPGRPPRSGASGILTPRASTTSRNGAWAGCTTAGRRSLRSELRRATVLSEAPVPVIPARKCFQARVSDECSMHADSRLRRPAKIISVATPCDSRATRFWQIDGTLGVQAQVHRGDGGPLDRTLEKDVRAARRPSRAAPAIDEFPNPRSSQIAKSSLSLVVPAEEDQPMAVAPSYRLPVLGADSTGGSMRHRPMRDPAKPCSLSRHHLPGDFLPSHPVPWPLEKPGLGETPAIGFEPCGPRTHRRPWPQ